MQGDLHRALNNPVSAEALRWRNQCALPQHTCSCAETVTQQSASAVRARVCQLSQQSLALPRHGILCSPKPQNTAPGGWCSAADACTGFTWIIARQAWPDSTHAAGGSRWRWTWHKGWPFCMMRASAIWTSLRQTCAPQLCCAFAWSDCSLQASPGSCIVQALVANKQLSDVASAWHRACLLCLGKGERS